MTATAEINWLPYLFDVRPMYEKYASVRDEAMRLYPECDHWTIDTEEVGRVTFYKDALFREAGNAFGNVQAPFGGPNPLLSTALAGALGAGVGYGGGKLMEKLMPDKYFKKGRLSKSLAIAGGLAGAAIPTALYSYPMVAEHGIKGMIMHGPYGPNAAPPLPAKVAGYQEILDDLEKESGVVFEPDEVFLKAAGAGGLFLSKIHTDMFNRVVLDDPYTPRPVQAAVVATTTAASAARGGSSLVSPWDIGRVLIGAGSGLVSGMIVGRTLGALAGLRPNAQKRIQQAGIMAGLLKTIMPMAFGR
jgi:hypothetical protein